MTEATPLRIVPALDPSAGNPALATIHNRKDFAFPCETFEQERLYRKQRLAVAFRLFARLGFDFGASGHITVRDPEFADRFWVNPVMRHFADMRVSDLLLVDHDGTILEGDGRVNSAGFAIHSQLHAARPDVVAAAHTHSVHGKAWSAFGRTIDPLTQDSAMFHDDVAVFDAFSGMVDSLDEGQRIAASLGSRNSIILQNHGILTVGMTVESAIWRYVALENACQVQLLTMAAGGARPMSEDIARHTRDQLGSDFVALYMFEPYWQSVIRKEPDVLD